MSKRIILHCDLNNFFASAECLNRADLKGKAVAVAGSVQKRHGIILAKNEAAKKFGVKTAEAIWQAQQKCPNLVLLEPHYEKYTELSRTVRAIYDRYTDIIEPFGIDECWLDVTGSTMLFGSGEQMANEIREKVKAETGLTISVGVSFNKIFAKLGSDLKKPDAVTVISRKHFREKVWPLDVGDLFGVGKATNRCLERMGILSIGDLAKTPPQILHTVLGKGGEMLWRFANGLDYSPVVGSHLTPVPKSVGRSTTPPYDLKTWDDIILTLIWLCERVNHSLHKNHALATVIHVHTRDCDLNIKEHQQVLSQPVRLTEILLKTGIDLIGDIWDEKTPLRSIGIRASELVNEDECIQLTLDCDYEHLEKMENLELELEAIRERYGRDAVVLCRQISGGCPEAHAAFGQPVA